jgi:hypothetical protein
MTDGHYADGVFSFSHSFEGDVAWFAYFAPYSMERHQDLIARHGQQAGCRPP